MSINSIQALPKLDAGSNSVNPPPLPSAEEQDKSKQPSDLDLLRAELAAMDQNYRRSFDPLWFMRSGWHRKLLTLLSWTAILSWFGRIKVLIASSSGRARETLSPLFKRTMELGRSALQRGWSLAASAVSRLPRRKAAPPVAQSTPQAPSKDHITERIRIRPPSKTDDQALEKLAQRLETIRGALQKHKAPAQALEDNNSQLMVAINEGEVVGFVFRKKPSKPS